MDVDLLIANVFKRSPLWDKRDQRHSNRMTTDRLWCEIATDMGIEEKALRRKWKYLRDNFATEYSKRPICRSGDAADNRSHSKWAYYQQLMFLKDIITPRASTGSFQSLLTSSQAESVLEDDATYDPGPLDTFPQGAMAVDLTQSCQEQRDSSDGEGNGHPEYHDVPLTSTGPLNIIPSIPQPRKRKAEDHYKRLLEIEQQKLQYLCNKEARKTNEDEDGDLLFLKSLIPHIKKIPQHKKLRFRNRMQAVVDEFAYPDNVADDEIFSRESTDSDGPNTHQSYQTYKSTFIRSSPCPPFHSPLPSPSATIASDQQMRRW